MTDPNSVFSSEQLAGRVLEFPTEEALFMTILNNTIKIYFCCPSGPGNGVG
jgi:hypothetical protein